MIKAKEELLQKLNYFQKEKSDIKNAYIECGNEIILKVDFTDEEYEQFLKEMDFEYDSGYTILFKYNSWLERYEYDGSERWVYKRYPKINEKCFRE